jgi:hypothetical protein
VTPSRRPESANCLRCGKQFAPRKLGHLFCSTACRHRGERQPGDPPIDDEALERLFDPSRDPDERVRDDEWCAGMDAEWAELYAEDTLAARRRWYANLIQAGRL